MKDLFLRDIENAKTTFDIKGHKEIINSIDGMGGGTWQDGFYGPPEICTGSRDG